MSTPQNAVTAEAGNSSVTIHARVGDSAIDKVTRLFSAGLADIFTETLQNSRRGGANRVAATIEQDGDTTRVTLADDGAGIADPAILLTFGESNWKPGIAEAEDPAGFGLLALSRRGCTLRWRVPGQDPSPGCRLVLEPAHFLGRDAAHVVPDDSAPWPHGTAVTFEAPEAPHSVCAFLETAARHYPLPVTIDGEVVERRAFLDGALHVEPWKGLVFGVFKDRHAGYRVPDVNFHGLTLPVRLPQIDTVEGGVWSARTDIDSCPDLELVLPARKEAVETPFLEEMRGAARLAVYRAMAQADPAPRVAWTDWHKAKEAGIEMPQPPAELRPWRPGIADTDYWDERSAFTAVGSGALVMQADPEPPEAQALHRALGPAGLQNESKPALRLFAPEPRFEGYPWYDTLARVTGIETLVTVDGAIRSLDYFTRGENACEPERPETIVMHLNVLHPPKSRRHCFRKCDTIAVPADLAFAGEAWSLVHNALPLVRADSDIAPEELARLLRAAYFSPSDDADADSWETQLTRFEEDALHMSLKLMCSVRGSPPAHHRRCGMAGNLLAHAARPHGHHRGARRQGQRRYRTRMHGSRNRHRGAGVMTHYTVCCGYASHYHNTVTVDADTLDEALEKAIEQAGDDPHWKSVDQASQTFVEALAEGMDADPWGDTALPVPDRFSEKGEPPVVTLTGLRPPGGIEVAGGAVRIRFIEDDSTITTEVTDPPAPPGNKPLVTIGRRADGAPDMTVRGGRARVLILDPGDTGPPPGG